MNMHKNKLYISTWSFIFLHRINIPSPDDGGKIFIDYPSTLELTYALACEVNEEFPTVKIIFHDNTDTQILHSNHMLDKLSQALLFYSPPAPGTDACLVDNSLHFLDWTVLSPT